MKTDTPFVRSGGGLRLRWGAGRTVEWGHCFDHVRGYRVFVCFVDSSARNTLSAKAARDLMAELVDPLRTDDAKNFSEHVRRMADQVDALNHHWRSVGCPPEPLDRHLAGGRA